MGAISETAGKAKFPLIIAEVGVNHNGSLSLAEDLITVAADAGADIVKFQSFDARDLAHPLAPMAEYQTGVSDGAGSQLDLLKSLELSDEDFFNLAKFCEWSGVEFLATAFSPRRSDSLSELGQKRFKIPSGELTNLPFLQHLGRKKQDLILSTGMAELDEIQEAIMVLEKAGTPRSRITVLQCTSAYPAPLEEANLLAMVAMREILGVSVGYSDHTVGEIAGGAAAAFGATVIEKHITLDKNMPGPDHKASADPEEFRRYIEHIRKVVKTLGVSEKTVTQSELENRVLVRRSIFAAREIQKGDLLSEQNLVCLRPATGISAMEWDNVIGETASKAFRPGDEITL